MIRIPGQHRLAVVSILKLKRPLVSLAVDRDGRLAVQPQLTPVDSAHRFVEPQRHAVEPVELPRLG